MRNTRFSLYRASLLALLGTTISLAAPAHARELRQVVSHTDMCRINPIRQAPLRPAKDALIEADHHARDAMAAEVRTRSQLEIALERYADLQASFAPRQELKEARQMVAEARRQHDLALALMEQADAERLLGEAELELGKLQLLLAADVEGLAPYRLTRFEEQVTEAEEELDRATERVERLNRRLAQERGDAVATR